MEPVALKLKVQKRIFFSDDSGYAVCKAEIIDNKESITIVGNLMDVSEGDFLEIEGQFVEHPKFGKQLKISSFKSLVPEDEEGMIKYLKTRIYGLGKKTAKKIVDHFGKETFKILEESPERVLEIKGIQKKAIEDIKKNFATNRMLRELTVKLAPFGIGNETIFKIYKEFKEDSFSILESNPYLLIQVLRGVGFKIADTIARGFGVAANDLYRIKAGIHYILNAVEQNNGDLYIESFQLNQKASRLLGINENEVQPAIDEMVERGQLIRENVPEIGDVLINEKNYFIEKKIAELLFNLEIPDYDLSPVQPDFHYIYKRTAIQLTEEQQQAVEYAVNNRITIITGGPGTGKTTVICAIIESFLKEEKKVLVAAPTGRAAKRVEEATGYQASTIHRMLQVDPETGRFVYNDENPLKADAVIIDEFSMVDFFLFYSLLKALANNTRLIIIGDKDQLPSVGPGNVLRDIITSNFFNVIFLSRNFRQEENSLIIDNAYRINQGENLIFKPYSDDLDFVFIRVTSENQAMEKVMGIIEYHKNDFPYNSPDFQVLVPMYRGEAGIDSLNEKIQERFNQNQIALKKERLSLKQNDKVMQLKNNYEKMVFNGEQGIVYNYKKDENLVYIRFDDNFKDYTPDELEELTLSYAISVHKSQGSEYDMLVLVLLPGHSIMLNRELFYTAVTRAKKKIFLISDPYTIQQAIVNAAPSKRKTLLPRRLTEFFS